MISFVGLMKTIITLGAVQGLIAGALLFWGRRNRKANRYLAFMIWFFSLACLDLRLYQDTQVYHTFVGGLISIFIPRVVIMPLGPLFYFYVRASIDPAFRWEKRYRKHFYSAVLDLMPHIAAVFYIPALLMGYVPKGFDLSWYIDTYNVYVDIPRWISFTVYLWLAARLLAAAKANGPSVAADDQSRSISLRWLQLFVRVFLGFQVIWLIFLVPYVLPGNSEPLLAVVGWYPVYVPLALLIYWVGIKALLVTHSIPILIPARVATAATPLPAETVDNTLPLLKKAMEEERLFLDPALSLTTLSQHTGIAPKTISAVLNQHLLSSFNEFVNEYRIREFQKRMMQADLQTMTITGIAFDCGFNSQATFQRAFKQVTGMSPTEYRKSTAGQ